MNEKTASTIKTSKFLTFLTCPLGTADMAIPTTTNRLKAEVPMMVEGPRWPALKLFANMSAIQRQMTGEEDASTMNMLAAAWFQILTITTCDSPVSGSGTEDFFINDVMVSIDS